MRERGLLRCRGVIAATVKRLYWTLCRQATFVCSVVPVLPQVSKSLADKWLSRSDYSRWSDSDNLDQRWEARSARLARLVPKRSRVIEFGAGRGRLPVYLDAGCTYFASDLVARSPDTIVCDLNQRPLPNLQHLSLDVAVFAGVLEYIADLPALSRWLSTQVAVCVASYDAVDPPRWTIDRITELTRRKRCGYMNDYEVPQFVATFEASGFRCVQNDKWESQELYVFVSWAAPAILGTTTATTARGGSPD